MDLLSICKFNDGVKLNCCKYFKDSHKKIFENRFKIKIFNLLLFV